MPRNSARPFGPWQQPLPAEEHDPGFVLPGFETKSDAKSRRADRVKLLEKSRVEGCQEHHELADRLSACRPHGRCNSGACPICMRRARRWFVGAAIVVLKEISHGG